MMNGKHVKETGIIHYVFLVRKSLKFLSTMWVVFLDVGIWKWLWNFLQRRYLSSHGLCASQECSLQRLPLQQVWCHKLQESSRCWAHPGLSQSLHGQSQFAVSPLYLRSVSKPTNAVVWVWHTILLRDTRLLTVLTANNLESCPIVYRVWQVCVLVKICPKSGDWQSMSCILKVKMLRKFGICQIMTMCKN